MFWYFQSKPPEPIKFLSQLDFNAESPGDRGIKVERYNPISLFWGSQIAVEFLNRSNEKEFVYLNTASAEAFLKRNPNLSESRINVPTALRITELAIATLPGSEEKHKERLEKMGFLQTPKLTVKNYEPRDQSGSKITEFSKTPKADPPDSISEGLSTEEAIEISEARKRPPIDVITTDFTELKSLLKECIPESFSVNFKKLAEKDRIAFRVLIDKFRNHTTFSDDEQKYIRFYLAELEQLYPADRSQAEKFKQESYKSGLAFRQQRRQREGDVAENDSNKS